MIDMRVRKLTPEFSTYTIAKMGLWAFTRTAAQGLAPKVRVNAIGPGPTMQGARQSAEHFRRQREATILKRGADPEGIVRALGYFLEARGDGQFSAWMGAAPCMANARCPRGRVTALAQPWRDLCTGASPFTNLLRIS